MVVWTWRRSVQATSLKEVFVAAEDEEIVREVVKCGGEARLVKGNYRTGSDRVAAAVKSLKAPAVVNIQADTPLIEPEAINAALSLLEQRPEFEVTTAVRPIKSLAEYQDPNCVKVVMDHDDRCLYFSRAAIPAIRDKARAAELLTQIPVRKHVGLYCFRREALERFCNLPESSLEKSEGLEQLRILEFGGSIGAVELWESSPGVDTPEDLLAVERYITEKGIKRT